MYRWRLPGSLFGTLMGEGTKTKRLKFDDNDYSPLLDSESVTGHEAEDLAEAIERASGSESSGDLWVTPVPGVEASQGRREALARDVEEYLTNGGQIDVLPPGGKDGGD